MHVQAFQERLSKSAAWKALEGPGKAQQICSLESSKLRIDTPGISEMQPCHRASLERTEWSCMLPVSDSLGLTGLYTDTQCPWEQAGDKGEGSRQSQSVVKQGTEV